MLLLGWGAILLLVGAGCGAPKISGGDDDEHEGASGGRAGQGGTGGNGGTQGSGANGGAAGSTGGSTGGTGGSTCTVIGTGIPAPVAQTLQLCTSCHSRPPVNGAPFSLVTYADLVAFSSAYSGQTIAQRCVSRMQSNTMPPGGGATAAQIQAIQSWIDQGLPEALSCSGSGGASGAGGAAGTGGAPGTGGAAGSPYDTPPGCSSGTHWRSGEGAMMRPGEACIACHSRGEGPGFSIAGTIYQTAHEDLDCNGDGAAGLQVVISDQNGNVQVTLTPNQVGTFTSSGVISRPYRAKIVDANGRIREMAALQTSGDCNSCHTQNGANGAPGRIMAP